MRSATKLLGNNVNETCLCDSKSACALHQRSGDADVMDAASLAMVVHKQRLCTGSAHPREKKASYCTGY